MVRRQDAGPHQRMGDRRADQLRQAAYLGGGATRPATGKNQRPHSSPELLGNAMRGRRSERRRLDGRGRNDIRLKDFSKNVHRH